ncbi:MAG: hypothetical protein HQ536_03845 [Parcubacteria group bacterium]|nr:hypothetical protein [Parcubacteria group bacterium]
MTRLNLDIATLDLLEDLKKDFSISFQTKDVNYCEVFQKSKSAIIYYNPKIVNTESIAHELLHIWLTRFNYCIGNHIFLSTRSKKKLNKILNKFLCDYITNCCDHFKMYPKYIEMGYSPSEFLTNSLAPKASLKDVKKIKLKLLGLYKSHTINLYIGCLISILADHVENDYTEHQSILKNKDTELYRIITQFWAKWVDFDIENIDPIFNSDIELTDKFIEELTNWVDTKKVLHL